MWAVVQPDNANGNENCQGLDLSGQRYTFKDENCDMSNRYICHGHEQKHNRRLAGAERVSSGFWN